MQTRYSCLLNSRQNLPKVECAPLWCCRERGFFVRGLDGFSDAELALLVFLTAGVPKACQAAPWFRWWHMIGLKSKEEIAVKLLELSPQCHLTVKAILNALAVLETHLSHPHSAQHSYVDHKSVSYVPAPVSFTQEDVDVIMATATEAAVEQAHADSANRFNQHFHDTAAARSLDAKSGRALMRQDRHVVMRPFEGKRQFVRIGGSSLRSIPRQLVTGLRRHMIIFHFIVVMPHAPCMHRHGQSAHSTSSLSEIFPKPP